MPEQTEGDERSRSRDLPGEAIGDVRALTEDTAQKLARLFESSRPVGIEHAAEDKPVVDNAWGSMIIGLVLLAAAGAVLRRLAQ